MRTLTALVILACSLQWLGAGGATAAAKLTVVSAGMSRADGLVSLVVDVGSTASEPPTQRTPPTFSVTADTVPEQIDAVPLFTEQLAVGFVVDGSEDGSAALQPGINGATNFVLEQPLTGAVVVADKSPPDVMSTAEARPADVVRALNAIRADGQRQTSDALSVALRELERIPARSRMLILHTAAADAGGESATDLAARLIDAHTPLAVVSTAPDPGYWRDVARLTGGVLIAQGAGTAFAAFDQVANAMRSRYLLTFTPTYDPPFEVTVRVDTADGAATADAVVSEPPTSPAAAAADPDSGARRPLLLMIAALLAVLGLVFFVLVRRTRPAVAADLDSGGSGLLGRWPGLRLPDLSRLARPARPDAEPPTAPTRDDSTTEPVSVDSTTEPVRVDSPTVPIDVDAAKSAPNPTGVPTEALKGPETPARARNGAAPPMRAANGADTVTAPPSTDSSIDAPKGAARITNGSSGAGDTPAGAPAEASTAGPPRPPSPLPAASEPPRDHDAEPLATSGTCVCGCGRKVRPGRAFINWEHQSRWMRASWDGRRGV